MRVLGLDYGSKRIGVALGDTETRIASPWCVIEVKNWNAARLAITELVVREKIKHIVVGIPRPLQQRDVENIQVQEVKRFIEELRIQGLSIEEEDEVLSSRLAASQMIQRGQKGKRDDLAACVILQSWLDKQPPYVLPA